MTTAKILWVDDEIDSLNSIALVRVPRTNKA